MPVSFKLTTLPVSNERLAANVNSKVRVWAILVDIDGQGDDESGDTYA